jgi:hypothetical protein
MITNSFVAGCDLNGELCPILGAEWERRLGLWGHILLPVVLITIGLIILVQGGAFGL